MSYINVDESALGAYSQYWRSDIHGYITEEGGVCDLARACSGARLPR